MAVHSSESTVEWMWKSNLNPFSRKVEDEWRSYTEEQNVIIEKAYQNDEPAVLLKNYRLDFEKSVQISRDDSTKRRPIKRVVHNKGKKTLGDYFHR